MTAPHPAYARFSPPGCCAMIQKVFDDLTIGKTPPDRKSVERGCLALGIYGPTIHTQYNVNLNRFRRIHFETEA
jgi:hypothetical protein